jgi:hypothetical protein
VKTSHTARWAVTGCFHGAPLILLRQPTLAQTLGAAPLTAPFSWVQLPHARLYKSSLARAVCLTPIRLALFTQPFLFTCIALFCLATARPQNNIRSNR